MRFSSRAAALLLAGVLPLQMAAAPHAAAQSSLSPASPNTSSALGSSGRVNNSDPSPIKKIPGTPIEMPGGIVVQIMGDLLGRGLSDNVGFRSGDLGMMTPVGNGDEFAIVFGDSFRGDTLGAGEWMSPVGVVARMVDGVIEIVRPLNAGDRVNSLIKYFRAEGDNLTLIPSDIINIDGTIYMQGMWNHGIGNVDYTQIWKSTDNGATWRSVGTTSNNYMSGMGDLISWERGADGYIYVVSSSFKRDHPVYLSRFRPEQIGDRTTWQIFDPATGAWSSTGKPILSTGVQAGEMNLRYIDGHWVLVMFNEETLQIEVRASREIARDWNEVPVAVVAKHGSWKNPQTPDNFSQPYGGYIVPGSTLANMDIVVSQWNTSTNSRYNSTQFNVKGLDAFFGVTPAERPALDVTETPATVTEDQVLEDKLVEKAPDNVVVPVAE
ncbi:DUF4185 domain-containing protein [Corynebacterium senegalense]|uniref:DUF4185 domain-containing protein n=1 Tax=Corynebacterium senegalense TaxID=2080750 RepID=UPI001FEAFACA|nr:DUF4185 domain-containing protein [Corynebacterium senegalense]